MVQAVADNFCSSVTWKISVNFTVFLSNMQGAGLYIVLMKNNQVSSNLGRTHFQGLNSYKQPKPKKYLVYFRAVIRVVTQRSRGALRDNPNNGCEGDYKNKGKLKVSQRAIHGAQLF